MSDYLTDLRRDLVDAHARYGQRGAIERAARAHRPSRAGLTALAAAAAAVIAVVVGGVALTRGPDDQVVGRRAPGVVARVALGGPVDGMGLGGVASVSGAAWIAVNSGEVIRVDATTDRVTARIPIAGSSSRQPAPPTASSPAWRPATAPCGRRSFGSIHRTSTRRR